VRRVDEPNVIVGGLAAVGEFHGDDVVSKLDVLA
jgi:hypothetical protein